jgi:hypothetical protein
MIHDCLETKFKSHFPKKKRLQNLLRKIKTESKIINYLQKKIVKTCENYLNFYKY